MNDENDKSVYSFGVLAFVEGLLEQGELEMARMEIARLDRKILKEPHYSRAANINAYLDASTNPGKEVALRLTKSTQSLIDQIETMNLGTRWYVPRAIERTIKAFETLGVDSDVKIWTQKLTDVNVRIRELSPKQIKAPTTESTNADKNFKNDETN